MRLRVRLILPSRSTLDHSLQHSRIVQQKCTTLLCPAPKFSTTAMPQIKRRATSPVRPTSSKRVRQPDGEGIDHAHIAEKHGIVQREFYPPEMGNERCAQYNDGTIPRPIEVLRKTLSDTKADREKITGGKSVVHWFKRDLRLYDNRGLALASAKAKKDGKDLICVFIVSPEDYQAHFTSNARVDFDLRTLAIMKEDLRALNIPLAVYTVEKRKDVVSFLLAKCEEWNAKDLICNQEYEVDELRRESRLVKRGLEKGINVQVVDDDAVVAPGKLQTGSGKQYSVYSPWYRAWVKHLHEHPKLLELSEVPKANGSAAKEAYAEIFQMAIPEAPPNKSLDEEAKKRLASIFPAGEAEARKRLDRFLKEKISKYKDSRNFPAANSTSLLSVHFSSGTLSARTAIREAQATNSTKKLDGGTQGIITWISEVAWRDFYKHVLAHWPYVCMSKPFKFEYSDIEWEYDDELFRKWTEGQTGFPIVDAAMRQCKNMAYIHNRCRMIVASFLAKDLLLDWRQGEIYFMQNLIDGDFASNNGGWGFSASTGVDPQPYFRIFNPLLQSEKFDASGDYIRKWVPELRDIKGKAIHDPYGRGEGKLAEKNGYPKPIVDHAKARQKALERYKSGLGRSTANVGGGVHN